MSWKSLPNWIKGGAIGLILPFLYVIIKGVISILIKEECPIGCIAVVGVECPSIYSCFDFTVIQVYPLLFLLIGFLIGYIYGKIKSKNKTSKN